MRFERTTETFEVQHNGGAAPTSTFQPDTFNHVDAAGCGCPGCSGDAGEAGRDRASDVRAPEYANIDGTGGTVNNKPVWTVEQVAAHLNRTNLAWTPGPNHPTPASGSVDEIRFGFFETQQQLEDNGYVYFLGEAGYGLAEYFNFASFTEAQRSAARESMQAWDDLINPSLVETSADDADINFGNLASAPTTQAYARLPSTNLSGNATVNAQVQGIAGDIWISASQADNLQLDEGQYGIHTQVHEIGHALGLSHPGAYNAAPGLSITYPNNAEYAQDTRGYSVMSYFNASSLGARHFDFRISTTVYAATPLIHDIAAIQRIYGADMTTRTGDTVYGFNSNAGRDSYDFTKTAAPIMAIWDAGGDDTIDASGYDTQQLIDLTPGSLSSIGGVTINSAPTFEQTNANRAAIGLAPILLATYTANMAALAANPVVGRLTDNVGIAYGVTIENAIGGSGSDAMIGNAANNVLTGNAGDDVLMGRDGNDTLNGGTGNDMLDGGTGADLMTGGLGNDVYVIDDLQDRAVESANGGTDEIRTSLSSFTLGSTFENLTGLGTGDQRLTGNSGNNVVTGAAGNDRVDGGSGNDSLFGGLGNDTVIGGSGDDFLYGGEGNDNLDAGSGNDTVNGDGGDDRIDAGAGSDIIMGGLGIDTVTGGSGDDFVYGGEGNDNLDAGSGNDIINGDGGDDRIVAGAGDDIIIGGTGNDVMTGGSGNDVFVFGPGSGQDTITDFRAGQVLDWSAMTTAGITATTATSGRDTLISFSDGSSILLQNASSSAFRGEWFVDEAQNGSTALHSSDWLMAA